jgi:hypothetical protein
MLQKEKYPLTQYFDDPASSSSIKHSVRSVLLVIVSVGVTYWSLQSQQQDVLVINLSGRQRMLVQQMHIHRLLWVI